MSRSLEKFAIEPEAELLVDFVNTRDIESGGDEIGDQASLRAWISAHAGEEGGGAIDASEHRRILALRESLRALLRANSGCATKPAELLPLSEAAERSRYRASLSPDGRLALGPAGAGPAAFEARLLLAVERVQALGGWPRLKACLADECQWAFFDTSRNRSRTWCSMDECGNKVKTRRYRSRKATG